MVYPIIEELKCEISECRRCQDLGDKSLQNPFQIKGYENLRPFTTDYWADVYQNWNAEIVIVGQDWGNADEYCCTSELIKEDLLNETTLRVVANIQNMKLSSKNKKGATD